MGRYHTMDSDNSAVHITKKEQMMSRYIDAEYIKAVMINDRLMQGNAEFNLYAQQVETQVKAMPSIDVVRCKECRHCKKKRGTFRGEPIFFYRCAEHNRDVESDDYCSWGERSEE